MFFIILFFLFYIVSSFNYTEYCWILESNFNYNNPNNCMLNLAYPSSIAYYYVTIVPPDSYFTFGGEFLEKNVYESSLTVYNSNGLIDPYFDSINTFNSNGQIMYHVNNNNSELLYVLQRYYVNLDYYNENDLVYNLFDVFDVKKNQYLSVLSQDKREYYSDMIYKPLQTLISWISPTDNSSLSKFYLPGQFTGLFPDTNHFYLVALPGNYNLLKITGYFKPEKRFPFIDFTTVNQKTVSTDNGLPFYEFLNDDYTYEIYITSDDNFINPNLNIIKWNKDNNHKALLFRIIDYTDYGIANTTGPLNPDETKEMMNGFYPDIQFI